MQNNSAIAVLGALALETRLQTLQLLNSADGDGLPAGEIARRLGVAQNTLSDHLRILTAAGILTSERQSRNIIYRTNPGTLRDLVAFLIRDCGVVPDPNAGFSGE